MQFSYLTGNSLPVLKKRRSDEVIILFLKAPDKSLKRADLITRALFKVENVVPYSRDGACLDVEHSSSRETTIDTIKLRAQNEFV